MTRGAPRLSLAATVVWTAIGTGLYPTVPQVAPFILPLSLVAPLFWWRVKGVRGHISRFSHLDVLFAVTFGYLLLNASWSTAPTRAYAAVAAFFVAAVTVHFFSSSVPELPPRPLRAMAIGFYAGYVFIGTLLSIEIAFQHPLQTAFLATFPRLLPQSPSVLVETGMLKQILPQYFNSHVAALIFLFWPVMMIAGCLASRPAFRTVLTVGLLPIILAVFLSEHQTSMLALVGGMFVWLLHKGAPRTLRLTLFGTWVLACLAIVPMASASYKAELYRANVLWESAKERIVIWG